MSERPLEESCRLTLPPNTDPDWGKQLGEVCNFERVFGGNELLLARIRERLNPPPPEPEYGFDLGSLLGAPIVHGFIVGDKVWKSLSGLSHAERGNIAGTMPVYRVPELPDTVMVPIDSKGRPMCKPVDLASQTEPEPGAFPWGNDGKVIPPNPAHPLDPENTAWLKSSR